MAGRRRRPVVKAITARNNICVMLTYHTTGRILIQASGGPMDRADFAVFEELGEIGKQETGPGPYFPLPSSSHIVARAAHPKLLTRVGRRPGRAGKQETGYEPTGQTSEGGAMTQDWAYYHRARPDERSRATTQRLSRL